MKCPRCGYVCSDLDTCCLRCRMMAAEGRPRRFISLAEQTVVMSDLHGALPEPSSPRRPFVWLTALLIVLALLIGCLARHFVPQSHAPTPAPLTTIDASRTTTG